MKDWKSEAFIFTAMQKKGDKGSVSTEHVNHLRISRGLNTCVWGDLGNVGVILLRSLMNTYLNLAREWIYRTGAETLLCLNRRNIKMKKLPLWTGLVPLTVTDPPEECKVHCWPGCWQIFLNRHFPLTEVIMTGLCSEAWGFTFL